jgi:hypothetical protein
MIEEGSEQYYPVYDASHSIVGLYDSSCSTDGPANMTCLGKLAFGRSENWIRSAFGS